MIDAPPRPMAGGQGRAFVLALVFIAALTGVRLAVLFATPLELYPDEAQYWAWSRALAFGYFSKPPMIAWLIRATTAVGGDAEPWVRLAAPLLHAGAALALQRAGARLYGGWAGFWGAVLYSLMPGVQLSSGVITTDAPLLFFLALALWAYAGLMTASERGERLRCAAGLGLALGLACLAKYAALYFVLGMAVDALLRREARGRWDALSLGLTAALALAILAPNLIWNAGHGLETVGHTVANADWGGSAPEGPARPKPAFDLRQAPGFVVSQLGVFGPIPFVVLVGGAVWLARKRRLEGPDQMLLALALTPLLIVLVQAAISRANANWAGAAYCPGAVAAAAWLVRWRARAALAATAALQGAAGVLFFAAALSPGVANGIGLANAFKQERGWAAATRAVLARAQAEQVQARPLSAIAVDDRFLFNAFTYYGRDAFARPGAPPLAMWVRRSRPNSQAEATAPLIPSQGGRVLAVSMNRPYLPEMQADFRRVAPADILTFRLDPNPKRDRRLALFVGEGLAPRPRDPRTGLPILPGRPLERSVGGA